MNSDVSADADANADAAIVLLGHGSRDPAWREPMQRMQAALQARGHIASCAYLELCAPDVFSAVQDLRQTHPQLQRVVMYPVFIGMGTHTRCDLPRLQGELATAHPDLHFTLAPMLGSEQRLIDVATELAIAALGTLR